MESSQTLRLEGGRTLGYAEWGDTSGFPLFHFHGSSSSRLERPVQPEVFSGVRLVTIDRPGHGLSDFQPNRTLQDLRMMGRTFTNWGEIIRQLTLAG